MLGKGKIDVLKRKLVGSILGTELTFKYLICIVMGENVVAYHRADTFYWDIQVNMTSSNYSLDIDFNYYIENST